MNIIGIRITMCLVLGRYMTPSPTPDIQYININVNPHIYYYFMLTGKHRFKHKEISNHSKLLLFVKQPKKLKKGNHFLLVYIAFFLFFIA